MPVELLLADVGQELVPRGSLVETWQSPRLDEILVNPTFLIAVGVGVLMLPVAWIWLRWALRQLLKAPRKFKAGSIDASALRDGLNMGRLEFEVLDDGLRIARDLGEERYLWSAFQEVCETDQALFLMVDDQSAEIIPKRAFAAAQACEGFKSLAELEIRKAA